MPTILKFFDRLTTTTTTTTTWLVRIFLVTVVLLISGITFFYWWAGKQTEQALIEQTFHREQVIARAGAKSIEVHFLNTENGLKLLTRSQRIIAMGKEVQKVLEEYVADRQGTPTTGIAVVNSEGVIIANANNLGMPAEINVSVADRAYFAWAKSAGEGETYLGRPVVSLVGATKGQTIIPVASPIIENGKFKGVTVAVVLLSRLTELYLNPLKISEKTRVYLVDSEGVLFYAPYEKLTGVNYFDYLRDKPFPGSGEVEARLKKHVAENTEGKLDIMLPNEQKGGTLARFLVAHSPVVLGSTTLLLAVASPIEDVLLFFGPFRLQQSAGLIFGLVSIIIIIILFVFGIKLVQRQTYLEGFAEGRDHNNKES